MWDSLKLTLYSRHLYLSNTLLSIERKSYLLKIQIWIWGKIHPFSSYFIVVILKACRPFLFVSLSEYFFSRQYMAILQTVQEMCVTLTLLFPVFFLVGEIQVQKKTLCTKNFFWTKDKPLKNMWQKTSTKKGS